MKPMACEWVRTVNEISFKLDSELFDRIGISKLIHCVCVIPWSLVLHYIFCVLSMSFLAEINGIPKNKHHKKWHASLTYSDVWAQRWQGRYNVDKVYSTWKSLNLFLYCRLNYEHNYVHISMQFAEFSTTPVLNVKFNV